MSIDASSLGLNTGGVVAVQHATVGAAKARLPGLTNTAASEAKVAEAIKSFTDIITLDSELMDTIVPETTNPSIFVASRFKTLEAAMPGLFEALFNESGDPTFESAQKEFEAINQDVELLDSIRNSLLQG